MQALRIKLYQLRVRKRDGNRINPRYGSMDTTDLQASMAEIGQRYPIMVSFSEEGVYDIVDGERRFIAAKAMGWEALDAVVIDQEIGDDELLIAMLASGVNKRHPRVKIGEAIARLIESNTGISNTARAARILGLRPDRAILLLKLYYSPSDALKKRADEMSWLALARALQGNKEQQDEIAALKSPTGAKVKHLIEGSIPLQEARLIEDDGVLDEVREIRARISRILVDKPVDGRLAIILREIAKLIEEELNETE